MNSSARPCDCVASRNRRLSLKPQIPQTKPDDLRAPEASGESRGRGAGTGDWQLPEVFSAVIAVSKAISAIPMVLWSFQHSPVWVASWHLGYLRRFSWLLVEEEFFCCCSPLCRYGRRVCCRIECTASGCCVVLGPRALLHTPSGSLSPNRSVSSCYEGGLPLLTRKDPRVRCSFALLAYGLCSELSPCKIPLAKPPRKLGPCTTLHPAMFNGR